MMLNGQPPSRPPGDPLATRLIVWAIAVCGTAIIVGGTIALLRWML